MKELINCFNNRPIVKLKRTNYVINPLLDHEPETRFQLVDDVIKELSKLINFSKVNKIVCEEDRGGYIGSILAYKHKKSLAMVKWNPLGLEGQNGINFRNAYAEGKMYLYGVKKGDKVVLVEDLVDSGNTIISMIELLREKNIDIIDVVCIAEKVDLGGAKKIEESTGIKIKSILKFTAKGERSKILEIKGKKYD
jgi:adenine phosphoribosyltransferase